MYNFKSSTIYCKERHQFTIVSHFITPRWNYRWQDKQSKHKSRASAANVQENNLTGHIFTPQLGVVHTRHTSCTQKRLEMADAAKCSTKKEALTCIFIMNFTYCSCLFIISNCTVFVQRCLIWNRRTIGNKAVFRCCVSYEIVMHAEWIMHIVHITYHCTVHQLCVFIIQSSVFHLSSVLYSKW